MSDLDTLRSIYFPGECNIDQELFLHLTKSCLTLDCMSGYFSSGSLRELAGSISYYLQAKERSSMRFIVGPDISDEDFYSISEAVKRDKNLLPLLFPGFDINEESLRTNCVKALSYLISSGRLELRVALKRHGLFHTKCWLFDTSQGGIAVHGSGNATKGGLLVNFEHIIVSREWESLQSRFIYSEFRAKFEQIWSNTYEDISCIKLNAETLEYIHQIAVNTDWGHQTNSKIVNDLLSKLELIEDQSAKSKIRQLSVPDWLNYSTGPYSHQGKAINAWFDNGRNGIMSIATGGGKTLTSLVAAALLNHETEKLFVVIAVPTNPLLNQWASDVEGFGIDPINSYSKSKTFIRREIKIALRRLRHGSTRSEVLIVTHSGLKSDLLSDLSSGSLPTLLIADEVHNLGSVGFRSNPPRFFNYKIGLSATYERQFDTEGTDFLLDYFGGVVFDYSLKDAIGECLVPFEYYTHEVYLTAEEEDEFCELTFEIRKLAYAADYDDANSSKIKWKMLCLKRRRLIETAKNKIEVLDRILPKSKYDIEKTLIFCTDKYPDQILDVNELLRQRSVNYHQITQEETSNPKLLVNLIEDFKKGQMQVLTSKRVLNEGFNVPQVEVAYLVASNTVKRDWIQRLGRVLRQSSETGKTKAIIHDFLLLPLVQDEDIDNELRVLLMSEYKRITFFTGLSCNGLEHAGALYKANKILELVRAR